MKFWWERPNKVKTALAKGNLKLDSLEFVVLDEADTLFEMGFQKDIDALVSFADKDDSVSLSLFSATLPAQVEVYIGEKLQNKKLKKISFSNSHKVQAKIQTYNIFVSPKERLNLLEGFMKRTAHGRGIIFANQKNQVDEVLAHLKKVNPKMKVHGLHGDMASSERLKISKTFSQGKSQVLVATDVAARGIDVPELAWVLNYNLPKNAEFYLHRCGRTGRMGKAGSVYNLVSDRDAPLVSLINRAVKSQTALNLDTIDKDIETLRTRARRQPKKKIKQKRVKMTKRTRL